MALPPRGATARAEVWGHLAPSWHRAKANTALRGTMANACSKAEQAFCKGFLLNNTPSEPAVSTVKSDIALKKKKKNQSLLHSAEATSGMLERIHPNFSDSVGTPCMHLFLINSKATPPAHTAEECVNATGTMQHNCIIAQKTSAAFSIH